MPARNLLTGECLIAHRNYRPTGPPIPVLLLTGPEFDGELMPSLVPQIGSKGWVVTIPTAGAPSWKLVQGSDADLAAIRAAGYAITDGREAFS